MQLARDEPSGFLKMAKVMPASPLALKAIPWDAILANVPAIVRSAERLVSDTEGRRTALPRTSGGGGSAVSRGAGCQAMHPSGLQQTRLWTTLWTLGAKRRG